MTDIHEFVIKLPTFEYKNKTWSNLDLALRLKKGEFAPLQKFLIFFLYNWLIKLTIWSFILDVMKALFQHTGALISNKFTKHRKRHPNSQPLRQLSNYVSFTSVSELLESPTESKSNPATPSLKVTRPSVDRERKSKSPSRSPPAQLAHILPTSSPVTEVPMTNNGSAASLLEATTSTSNGIRSRAASVVKSIVSGKDNTVMNGNQPVGSNNSSRAPSLRAVKSASSDYSHLSNASIGRSLSISGSPLQKLKRRSKISVLLSNESNGQPKEENRIREISDEDGDDRERRNNSEPPERSPRGKDKKYNKFFRKLLN